MKPEIFLENIMPADIQLNPNELHGAVNPNAVTVAAGQAAPVTKPTTILNKFGLLGGNALPPTAQPTWKTAIDEQVRSFSNALEDFNGAKQDAGHNALLTPAGKNHAIEHARDKAHKTILRSAAITTRSIQGFRNYHANNAPQFTPANSKQDLLTHMRLDKMRDQLRAEDPLVVQSILTNASRRQDGKPILDAALTDEHPNENKRIIKSPQRAAELKDNFLRTVSPDHYQALDDLDSVEALHNINVATAEAALGRSKARQVLDEIRNRAQGSSAQDAEIGAPAEQAKQAQQSTFTGADHPSGA
jgi:hypothetical protein